MVGICEFLNSRINSVCCPPKMQCDSEHIKIRTFGAYANIRIPQTIRIQIDREHLFNNPSRFKTPSEVGGVTKAISGGFQMRGKTLLFTKIANRLVPPPPLTIFNLLIWDAARPFALRSLRSKELLNTCQRKNAEMLRFVTFSASEGLAFFL